MTERHEIKDVFAVVIPEQIDPRKPEVAATLPDVLRDLAVTKIKEQYEGGLARPASVELEDTMWLITDEADHAIKFELEHDCPACRAGADQMVAYLKDEKNAGRYVAMANLTYTEVWP